MGKELLKGMKRCSTSTSTSTSTDAEVSDHKDKKPLQIAESELQSSETQQKKRKKKSKSKQIDDDEEPKKTSEEMKEMKKLRKSFKEMTETMKNLQGFLMGKADLPGISMKELLLTTAPNTSVKEEEEPPKKLETYECCFETKDAEAINKFSVFVKGFDTSLARDDIKSGLRKHFESGGLEVTRVFVPIECQTGVRLGFAFIDVDDNQKALELGGGYLGGSWFRVRLAKYKSVCSEFPNFQGCEHCGSFLSERRAKRFLANPWR